ncbi:MAG: hypothetical protein B7Y88_00360 [Sphingomonadales bacterium 32-64-17]|nr:MAG: hypothetical protein B7Y88_00360 [Sphingomonadales bacterium 32-64-17]
MSRITSHALGRVPVVLSAVLLSGTAWSGIAQAQVTTATPATNAQASASDEDQRPRAAASGEGLNLDTIVVTGTAQGQRQFDTSYAVTALNESEISKRGATGTADLLGQIPGVYAEVNSGEVQNIWRIRGVPDGGGFTEFQEDGAPIFASNNVSFGSADVLSRIDIMTESFEVVRGGSAPVYADQAIAIMNNISRRGSDQSEGAVRATAGSIGLGRIDGYWSGPIAQDTYIAVGGFYRISDGYRDNGYTADEGGQFRMNLTHEFDGGNVNLFVRVLDDKNAFYLPVPLANPDDPSESLADLLDPMTGTMNTPHLANATTLYALPNGDTGSFTSDLTDGRHIKMTTVGLDFTKEFSGGWEITNRLRFSDIDLDFIGLYSDGNPVEAEEFAARYLTAATAAFGTVAYFDYALAGTGGATLFDPADTAGLVVTGTFRTIHTDAKSALNDLRLNKTFDTGFGSHSLTMGVFASHLTHDYEIYQQRYLFEMRTQPRPIDLVARDSAGNAIGFVTDDGVLAYGTSVQKDTAEANHIALYIEDQWNLTDALRIDGGLRWQYTDYRGGRYAEGVYNLGDATTLADNSVRGLTGQYIAGSGENDFLSWTIGAHYEISPILAGYARYAKSFNAPAARSVARGSEINLTEVDQYEVGLKLDTRMLQVFATAFYAKYSPFSAAGEGIDPITGQIVQRNYQGDALSPGAEIAASFRPVSWFTLDAAVTYNDIEMNELTDEFGGEPLNANGNQPTRVPKYYGNIQPSVNFALGDVDLDAYARFNFIGRRFVDVANSTALPAYQTLDIGVGASFGDFDLRLIARNVTDAFGLNEGNPRADNLTGQGTAEPIYGRPIFGRTFELSATLNF